uniref:Aquaporin n=1 Tax=Parastrongyloides trichosuri TaxID=131310 RepID=A0A0N4ZV99_PARTI
MRLWIASLLFYIFIYIICEIGRLQFSIFDKSKHKSIIILLEFIGTIQICAPMFDVNLIIESYGIGGVFIEITFIEICNSFLLRDAFADPCPLIGKLINNKKPWKWLSILLGTQFLAGLVSFKIAKYWWSFKFHPAYNEMISDVNCEADLTVTLIYGMFVEGMGVVSSKYINDILEKYIDNEIWNILLNAASSGIVCVLGISLTGMYANPIVAWACTFNCKGVSHWGHFLVYWFAPIMAHFWIGNFDEDDICKNNEIIKEKSLEKNPINNIDAKKVEDVIEDINIDGEVIEKNPNVTFIFTSHTDDDKMEDIKDVESEVEEELEEEEIEEEELSEESISESYCTD